MSLQNNILIALGLLVAGFAGGWFGRGKEIQMVEIPKVVHHTDTQVQVKTVDHVITKTITKTVRIPSGATTTTVTQTVDKAETVDKQQETKSDNVASVPQALANWSVGVQVTPRLSPDAYKPTSADVGYRVIGPMWATGAFDWRNHETKLGIRVDF